MFGKITFCLGGLAFWVIGTILYFGGYVEDLVSGIIGSMGIMVMGIGWMVWDIYNKTHEK